MLFFLSRFLPFRLEFLVNICGRNYPEELQPYQEEDNSPESILTIPDLDNDSSDGEWAGRINQFKVPKTPLGGDGRIVSGPSQDDTTPMSRIPGSKNGNTFANRVTDFFRSSSKRNIKISAPENPVHITRVSYDRPTEQFSVRRPSVFNTGQFGVFYICLCSTSVVNLTNYIYF